MYHEKPPLLGGHAIDDHIGRNTVLYRTQRRKSQARSQGPSPLPFIIASSTLVMPFFLLSGFTAGAIALQA